MDCKEERISSFKQDERKEPIPVFRVKTNYKCPLCGGSVKELPAFYGCDNYKPERGGCPYKLFKTIYEVPIPRKFMIELLETGVTEGKMAGLYDKKENRLFKARLKYNPSLRRIDFIDREWMTCDNNLQEEGVKENG